MKEKLKFLQDWRAWVTNKIQKDKLPKKVFETMFLSNNQYTFFQNIVYSLELFCTEFFKKHPKRIVCPRLITQSSLELLFGNIKQGGRNLDEQQFTYRLAVIKATRKIYKLNCYNDSTTDNYDKQNVPIEKCEGNVTVFGSTTSEVICKVEVVGRDIEIENPINIIPNNSNITIYFSSISKTLKTHGSILYKILPVQNSITEKKKIWESLKEETPWRKTSLFFYNKK